MRRPRDIALRAGFYLAAALSGFAAAYVLRQYLWNPRRALSDRDTPNDEKPSSQPQPSTHAHPSDEAPPPVTSDPEHTLPVPVPSPNTDRDAHVPSTSQTKTLPPIRTHSLPPPIPSAHALLSGSFASINPVTSPTMFAGSSDEDGVDEQGAARTNTSDSDSFVDILSPVPMHVVSGRRSVRAHDLFAQSHISFTELGSFVAPQNELE